MNPQWRGQSVFRTVYFVSNVYASGEKRIRIKEKWDNVDELLEAKYFTVSTFSPDPSTSQLHQSRVL